jgi:WD40 repeat protein
MTPRSSARGLPATKSLCLAALLGTAIAALALARPAAAAAPPLLPQPSWQLPKTHHGLLAKLALTPDGRLVGVLGYCDDNLCLMLKVWDTVTKKSVLQTAPGRRGSGAVNLVFLPGGKKVVVLVGGGGRVDVRVVDVLTGDVRKEFTLPATCGQVSAVSPDGKRLVVSGDDRVFSVYDLANLEGGLELDRLSGHEPMPITNFPLRDDNAEEYTARYGNTVTQLQFSPDGKFLAVGTKGGWVSLWDLGQKARLWRKRPIASQVRCLSFSPDGTILAATGGLTLLRASDGQEGPPIHERVGGSWAYFLSNGNTLIVSDPTERSRVGFLGWDSSARRVIGESWRTVDNLSLPSKERKKLFTPGMQQAVVSADRSVMVTERVPNRIEVWDLRDIWPR